VKFTAVLINALKPVFALVEAPSAAIVNIRKIVMNAEQGDFMLFAKFFDTFYISDRSGAEDSLVYEFFKSLTDDSGVAEAAAKSLLKAASDVGLVTEQALIEFGRSLSDEARVQESHTLSVEKPLAEIVANAEDSTYIFTKKVKEDEATFAEQIDIKEVGKGISDAPGVAEQYASSLARSTSDAATVGDEYAPTVGKVHSDGTELSDGIDTIDVGKGLSETPTFAELFANDMSKPLADTSGVVSTPSLGPNKVVSDGAGTSDDIDYFITAKAIFDAVSVTDDVDGVASILDDQELSVFKQVTNVAGVAEAIYRQVNYLRSFADTSAATDALAYELARFLADESAVNEAIAITTQRPLSDSASIGLDELELDFGKAPSDSPILSESIVVDSDKMLYDESTAADVASLHTGRPASDTLAVSDVETKAPNKVPSELASITDTGSLRSQGYCDFTYFAEDYVGASRTF
jgi:hypothetical protein